MKVIERSEGRYVVESENQTGRWYWVKRLPEGKWSCNCEANIFHEETACKHILSVKELHDDNLPLP